MCGPATLSDWRQGLQESVKIGDILHLHARVGCIREGRIKMPAIWRDAFHHRIGEIGEGPVADALLRWGNVWRYEGAERRDEVDTARQHQPCIALGTRGCMAGGAASLPEDAHATLWITGSYRGKLCRIDMGGCREQPEPGPANQCQNDDEQCELAHHPFT